MIKRIIDKINRICIAIYHHETKRKMAFCGKNVVFENNVRIDCPQFLSMGNDIYVSANTKIYFALSEQNSTPQLVIKDSTYIGRNCQISCCSKITIQEKVMIADNCYIGDSEHIYNKRQAIIDSGIQSRGDIVIGDGSWIGANVCILPNVSIGKHCVVGAGSVVTKSIPDYTIAVGNPARIIKYIEIDK